jgi:DnaJ-class molecular chaperone
MEADYFAILGLERKITVNSEELQGCYDTRCQEVHPDSGGAAAEFEEVRRAYAELRSPGRRLRHWLELGGRRFEEGGALPQVVMEHFGGIGDLLQESRGVEERHATAQSALGRSMAERAGLALLPRLQAARERTEELIQDLEARFGEFEDDGGSSSSAQEEAIGAARALLFLEKWETQLREAWGKLGCW